MAKLSSRAMDIRKQAEQYAQLSPDLDPRTINAILFNLVFSLAGQVAELSQKLEAERTLIVKGII